MSEGLMVYIHTNLSSEEPQGSTERIECEHGLSVHAGTSSKPDLHCVSTATPPHIVLRPVRKQGYHACLVDA
jgi:hypothetical protein